MEHAARVFMLEKISRYSVSDRETYQVQVAKRVFQLQRQHILLQGHKVEGKLGHVDIADDSSLF